LRHFILILFLLLSQSAVAQTTTVAVAANMKDAFTEISTAFKSTGKPELRVVYGSSGNFTAQILNGAPFSMLIAADEYFPLELYKKGKTIDAGAIYAIGSLAMISKKSSNIKLTDKKIGLTESIAKANKIAIAKPDLSPYGKAAVEYMKSEGVWDLAKDKLIYGDNIGIATMYVLRGGADLGFTALSLTRSAEISKEISLTLANPNLYEPIKQRMVLIKGASQEAIDLYQFMQGSKAKSILDKYGYATP
jgi:molybdate transport system substrate-binding protein